MEMNTFTVEKGTNIVSVVGFRNAIANAKQFVEYCNNEVARVFDTDDNLIAVARWNIFDEKVEVV